MPDERAQTILREFEKEEGKAANFRNLYQEAADYIFPRENQINSISSPGEKKTDHLTDTTAVMASIEMASGLSQNLVPPGQRFFVIRASLRALNEIEAVKQYLGEATEIVHEQLYGSNFMLQLNETLRSLCVFGTANLFSEFTTFLNFRDYDIGQYIILENSKGRVDTMYMKFSYTARQAYQEWKDNVGEKVIEALKDKPNDLFEFLHVVQPREDRKPGLSDNLNMPYESLYINIKEKMFVDEGGFPEFPYAVPRWTKASNEVFGRGQGTFLLPDIKLLQVIKRDLVECADKHNRPPLEILQSFEGDVDMGPHGRNIVAELGSVRAIDRNAQGNFPITKDILEMQQELVRKGFYNDVFVLLTNLKGDRRPVEHIRALIAEGLQRIGPPIGRINEELFNPCITRVILLLLRNGQLPPMPPELEGQSFKLEYVSRLALELRSQQAQGLVRWVSIGAEMEAVFPGVTDNVDFDTAYRDLGAGYGVNVEHIASLEDVQAKREARAKQLQQQQMMEALETAGKVYPGSTKSPEAGSPAEALLGAK